MAISDRITSIEEHIKESYQELEGIGIDTTGVNKNLENIPKLIDGYWETLPKVTGEGTSITLDNTKEGKMKINLKGNTSQATTTGKNLAPTDWASKFVSAVNNTGLAKIETKDGRNCLMYVQNAGYGDYPNKNLTLGMTFKENTQYTVSFDIYKINSTARTVGIRYTDGSYTTPSNLNATDIWEHQSVTSTAGKTIDYICPYYTSGNTYIDIDTWQIEEGTIETEYEPYTNGASPNPDYPQDIHVVSGDNTIKVCGKNLLDTSPSNTTLSAYFNSTTGAIESDSTHSNCIFNDYIEVKPNTNYTLSSKETTIYTIYAYAEYDSNKNFLNYVTTSNQHPIVYTFTTSTNTKYIRIRYKWNANTTITNDIIKDKKLQLEQGSTATTYEPYQSTSYPINLGDIELCKIGDYQDSIKKSTGKNLFDKNNINGLNAYLDTTNNKLVSNNNNKSIYISCKPNTTYTISKTPSKRFGVAYTYTTPENNTAIYGTITNYDGASITITTDTNAQYLVVWLINSNISGEISYQTAIDTLQIELGNQATPYEPYGTGWYLNKQIGKVVLNGSEDGWSTYNTATGLSYLFNVSNIKVITSTTTIADLLCNYYIKNSQGTIYSETQDYCIAQRANQSQLLFRNKDITTLNDFKTWLSNNNTTVYYIQETPTYTEITDSTLISQLNALAKSYASQTNISQESNDLASILNATALEEME